MPVLKHAKKKLRQDVRRTRDNKRVKTLFKALVKKARVTKSDDTLSSAYQAIDKAAKQNIIHPNKAARLKSSLVKEKTPVPAAKPGRKKTVAARAKANKSTIASKAAAKAKK
jgi:small subunit ribosomal protein S20